MLNSSKKRFFSLISVLIFLQVFPLFMLGQSGSAGTDVVLKTNGDELIGKVVEINDSDIKFYYAGETLAYTLKKSEIIKITFASGRIEFFNRPASNDQSLGNSISISSKVGEEFGKILEHHNKVAILPFHYLIDKRDAGEEITYEVQMEAFSFLSRHVGELKLQDVNTTNALLIKAGVNNNNIRGYTMGEICNILGVEYIIQGTITQSRTNVSNSTTYSTTHTSGTDQSHKNSIIGSIFNTSNPSDRTSGNTTSTQNYETSMLINVHNDKGDNMFSQNHKGFWNSTNAYKITLQYLLKRIPLYRK